MPVLYGPNGEQLTKDRSDAVRRFRSDYRRNLKARYDAAQTTVENEKHWAQADGLSARAAGSAEIRKRLRERARYEVANDSYAAGMVQTKTIAVIGSSPRLQISIANSEAAVEIARRFREWAQAIDLGAKLRLMYRSYIVDGEGFMLRTLNSRLPESGVQLDYRVYESDQVSTPYWRQERDNYIDGVYLDANGEPKAYDVLNYHPGDDLGYDLTKKNALGATRYRARRQLIHLFRTERAGQVRGIPHLTPALALFAKRRRFALATITAAETAANLSAILFTDHPGLTDADIAALDDDSFFDLPRGSIPVMPMGYKISQLKGEHPSDTYSQFNDAILQEVGRCLGLPQIVAMANSQDANYASGRLDYQGWHQLIHVERQWLECRVLNVILEHWLDEALNLPGYLPAEAYQSPLPHRWYFDPQPHVDPEKEANAVLSLWEKGLAVDEDYFLETLGRDPAEMYAALKMQNEQRKTFGLPYPGQAEEMQREQAEAEAEAAKAQERSKAEGGKPSDKPGTKSGDKSK